MVAAIDDQRRAAAVMLAACVLAEHGLHVIPVELRGKKPTLDSWQTRGSVEASTITAWFGRTPLNVGVVCGLSELVVIDVDPRNGGAETFARLVADLGELPPTITADTGGGGAHFVFRAPKPLPDLLKKLGDGLELLHGGMQFLVEPSIHPSGGAYRWRAGLAPGEIAIAELPAAWIERATRPAPRVAPRVEPAAPADDRRVERARAYLAKMPPAVSGQHGHDALWDATCRVMHGFGLDDTDTRALIVNEYNPRCDPPWSEREIEHKIAQAREVADADKWRVEDREQARATSGSTTASTDSSWHDSVKGATDGSKAPEPGTFEHDLATALEDVRKALGATNITTRAPLFEIDAVDLLRQQFDAARWLVTGLVTVGGITMIGAEPKAAKTWLGTEIAIAVATGTKVCGEFYAQHGTVAVFYAEDLDVQVRNRVRALLGGAGRTIQPGRLRLCPRGQFLDVTKDEDLAWIVASCRKLGKIDLLVLDPLSDIHSGEEDKRDSMAVVMRRLRLLATLLGCTVAVVHHAPKSTKENSARRPGQNLRGSGAIHGSIDSGLYLTETGGDGTTTFTNTVTSQVKGARSAGRFHLGLAVRDDDQGEAVEAVWTVSREAPPAKGKEGSDALLAFIRELAMRGEFHNRRGLREHDARPAAVPKAKVYALADQLVHDGLCRLDREGVVRLAEPTPPRGIS